MLKKAKVVMLAANGKAKEGMIMKYSNSRLVQITRSKFGNELFDQGIEYSLYYKCSLQHLYILSDDKIKVGDWYFSEGNKTEEYSVHNCDTERLAYICNESNVANYCKKIIASTNPNLNLPKPSNAFIENYCQLGGIDEVMIEYFEVYQDSILVHNESIAEVYALDQANAEYEKTSFGWNEVYDIAYSEKLKELGGPNKTKLVPKVSSDNTITIKPIKDNFSRREVLDIIEKICFNQGDDDYINHYVSWFNNNY